MHKFSFFTTFFCFLFVIELDERMRCCRVKFHQEENFRRVKCSFHSHLWSAKGAAKAVFRRGFGDIWWCGKSMPPIAAFSTKDEQKCPLTATCFLFLCFLFLLRENGDLLLSTSSPHADETWEMIQTGIIRRNTLHKREISWAILGKDRNVRRGTFCCN